MNRHERPARIIATLVIALPLLFTTIAHGDLYHFPTKPYECETFDGRYVLRVNIHDEDDKQTPKNRSIQLFRTKDKARTLLWECALPDHIFPSDLRVSPNERTVVLLDQIGPFGAGDVVSICDQRGVLAQYTIAQLLGMTEDELDEFVEDDPNHAPFEPGYYHRVWRCHAADLFDRTDDGPCFAIWVSYAPEWFAFDLTTGRRIKPNADDSNRWRQRLKQRARKTLTQFDFRNSAAFLADEHRGPWAAFNLLTAMRDPQDQPTIDRMFTIPWFATDFRRPLIALDGESPIPASFTIHSPVRSAAARQRPVWEGRLFGSIEFMKRGYDDDFGELSAQVRLPAIPRSTDGHLTLNLVPHDVHPNHAANQKVTHVARIDFSKWVVDDPTPDDWQPSARISFSWEQIRYGKYWIKAVWDRNPDHQLPWEPIIDLTGDFHSTQSGIYEIAKPGHQKPIPTDVVSCTTPIIPPQDH